MTNQVSLAGLDILSGLPEKTRSRLVPISSLTPIEAGHLVALEKRRTDYAYILVDGAIRAHRGLDERSRRTWGRGTTLGIWKRSELRAPSTFSVAKSGTALVAPMAIVEKMGLGSDYARYAATPAPSDFAKTRRPPNDFVIINRFLGRSRFASALDIGAGQGTLSKVLHWSADKVTLLDPDPAALAEAKRILTFVGGGPWFELRVGTAQRLDFPDASFDLIATRLAVHHVSDLDAMLMEVRRCLRPGGTLLISDIVAPRSGVELLNELERAVDPTHHEIRPRSAVADALARAGFAIEKEETTLRRAEVDARPCSETANPRCAKIIRRATESDRRALGIFQGESGRWGWVDRRLVLLARRNEARS